MSGAARKVSEGTLLRRVYKAMREVRALKALFDAETREVWVEALLEIRARSDDGFELWYDQPHAFHASHARFLQGLGATPAQLENLFDRGLLLDLDGRGVAMPYRFGLRSDTARPVRRVLTGADTDKLLAPRQLAALNVARVRWSRGSPGGAS